MRLWSLGGEDPLEENMATHSCILAWRIPWTEEPEGLQSIHKVTKSLTWQKRLTTHTHTCILLYRQSGVFTCNWRWNSNTLATSCKELTHWKRPGCWEGLGERGEGDDRGWDGWMASPTRWTWVWVNSRSWWWTGKTGMLWFLESQRVGHD